MRRDNARFGAGDCVDLRDVLRVEPGNHTRFARRVVGVIAAVHRVMGVPPLSIRVLALPDRERHGAFDGSLIIVNRLSATRDLALVHEIGHALDRFGIGTDARIDTSTTQHPLLHEWQRAVSRSHAVQELRQLRADLPASAIRARTYIGYLLSARELFARSYAQWLARRSGDETLFADISRIRTERGTVSALIHWEGDDFSPLGTALDRVMEALGWIP
jgi:hypothetical protein